MLSRLAGNCSNDGSGLSDEQRVDLAQRANFALSPTQVYAPVIVTNAPVAVVFPPANVNPSDGVAPVGRGVHHRACCPVLQS